MATETIIFQYQVDEKQLIDALRKTRDGIELTQKEIDVLGKHMQDGFIKGSDGAKRFTDELKKQPQTIVELERKLNNLNVILRDEAKVGTKAFELINAEIHKTEAAIKGATASAGKMITETKKLSQSVGGFKDQIIGLAGAMGIAFGTQQIIQFGKASVEAFIEAEKNAQSLSYALNGDAAATDRLIKLSSELESTTIYSDDSIQQAETFLATQGRTEEQIRKTIKAATQLATVQRIDLQTATERLDQTYEGQIGKLGKLDSKFKKFSQTQLENGAAIDFVNEKYAGFAEALAQTDAGKIEQLKNRFDNLQESIGGVILNGTVPLIESILKLNGELSMTNFDNWTDFFTEALNFQNSLSVSGQIGKWASEKLGLLDKEIEETDGSTAASYRKSEALKFLNGVQENTNKVFEKANQLYGVTREQFDKLVVAYQEANKKPPKDPIDFYKALNEELTKLTNHINNILARGGIVPESDIRRAAELQAQLKKIGEQRDKMLREQGILIKIAPDKIGFEEGIKELEGEIMPIQVPVQFVPEDKLGANGLDILTKRQDDAFNSFMDNIGNKKQADDDYKQHALDNANIIAGGLIDLSAQIVNAQNNATQSQLSDLEKEKNVKLSNAKLTAKERARIEAEFIRKEQELKRKQFEDNKTGSIVQAIINTALGITQAIAQGGVAGIITGAIVAAAGALEIGTIAAQENPYFEGTPFLERKGAPRGKDTIRIRANEGEAIIPTSRNAEEPGLAKAWIHGNLDEYLMRNYAAPLLKKQAEIYNREAMQSVLFQSNSSMDDKRILRELKTGNQISDAGFALLAQTLKRNKRTGLN